MARMTNRAIKEIGERTDYRYTVPKTKKDTEKLRKFLDQTAKKHGGWKALLADLFQMAKDPQNQRRLEAIEDILNRRFGKPAQAQVLTTEEGGPLPIVIIPAKMGDLDGKGR